MLARRLAGILPPLTFEEALECTSIHSVAGTLHAGAGLMMTRPFRAPHHSVSGVALVGGGSSPRPGEISLAHNGVLFLDEAPEFDRRVLESLRQPLEDGHVTIARAARTAVFPTRFVLVAAMNPCPCGFAGDDRRPCRCTPSQVAAYRGRLSGPLRDRIDMIVEVPAVPVNVLADEGPGESSESVRARVIAARSRRPVHDGRDSPARLDAASRSLLLTAARRLGLSARVYHRVLRVARTIADLGSSANIERDHVAEALQYRVAD
jgi:magnesium chelatase family protein